MTRDLDAANAEVSEWKFDANPGETLGNLNESEIAHMATLNEAKQTVELIESRRQALVAARMQLDTKLDRLQQDLGRRYLDGDSAVVNERLAILGELEAIEAGLGILDAERKLADVDVLRADARAKREQAAAMRQQSEELLEQARKPLADLSRLMGVEYTPCILSAQRDGDWGSPATAWGRPQELLSPFEVAPVPGLNTGRYLLTRPRQLLESPLKLEADAADIENKLQFEADRAAAPTPKKYPFVDRSTFPPMLVTSPGVSRPTRPGEEVA